MTLRMWLRLANQCCDRHSSPKPAVEALDVSVLHRLAGLDEAQLDGKHIPLEVFAQTLDSSQKPLTSGD